MNCIECGGRTEQTAPRSWDCLDCGAELYKANNGEIVVVGYRTDESEKLSVWDAADIYFSNGCDEDYSFGYTHDELTKAFNQ